MKVISCFLFWLASSLAMNGFWLVLMPEFWNPIAIGKFVAYLCMCIFLKLMCLDLLNIVMLMAKLNLQGTLIILFRYLTQCNLFNIIYFWQFRITCMQYIISFYWIKCCFFIFGRLGSWFSQTLSILYIFAMKLMYSTWEACKTLYNLIICWLLDSWSLDQLWRGFGPPGISRRETP